jgi:hypothetical protein
MTRTKEEQPTRNTGARSLMLVHRACCVPEQLMQATAAAAEHCYALAAADHSKPQQDCKTLLDGTTGGMHRTAESGLSVNITHPPDNVGDGKQHACNLHPFSKLCWPRFKSTNHLQHKDRSHGWGCHGPSTTQQTSLLTKTCPFNPPPTDNCRMLKCDTLRPVAALSERHDS